MLNIAILNLETNLDLPVNALCFKLFTFTTLDFDTFNFRPLKRFDFTFLNLIISKKT